MENTSKEFSEDTKPFLILGGTGKTGRRVVELLKGKGLPVRIGSRSSLLPFDWEDERTWQPVLQGVSAVYITYYPDLAVPKAEEAIATFSKMAIENGINRLVLLSGRGEEGAQQSEQALIDSGAEWTILRASWFFQNFSESFLLEPVRQGVLALPVGDIYEPFVDVDDIAEVAVAALIDKRHIGQLYELTGTRLLTFAEATEEIARASRRQVQYVCISNQEFTMGLKQQGLPMDVSDLLEDLFTNVLDGRNSYVTDGVQRALGKEPRDFSDYAKKTAMTGIWK